MLLRQKVPIERMVRTRAPGSSTLISQLEDTTGPRPVKSHLGGPTASSFCLVFFGYGLGIAGRSGGVDVMVCSFNGFVI